MEPILLFQVSSRVKSHGLTYLPRFTLFPVCRNDIVGVPIKISFLIRSSKLKISQNLKSCLDASTTSNLCCLQAQYKLIMGSDYCISKFLSFSPLNSQRIRPTIKMLSFPTKEQITCITRNDYRHQNNNNKYYLQNASLIHEGFKISHAHF